MFCSLNDNFSINLQIIFIIYILKQHGNEAEKIIKRPKKQLKKNSGALLIIVGNAPSHSKPLATRTMPNSKVKVLLKNIGALPELCKNFFFFLLILHGAGQAIVMDWALRNNPT